MAELTGREERTVATPFGEPSGPYVIGTLRGKRVAFLARHSAGHRISPTELNYRANIFGFKSMGVEFILSASAVGSLQERYAPQHLVIPDQFFDRTRGRVSTFFGNGLVAHVAFAHPVCGPLGAIAYESCRQAGATVHNGGTYVCMEGPQFSTLAESKLYRAWGMDIIGMTNLQEAKLAREAEICYVTVALVTDYDSWHPDHDAVTVDMIIQNLVANAKTAQQVIAETVSRLPFDRTCECAHALQHAIITRPDAVPERVKKDLAPIMEVHEVSPPSRLAKATVSFPGKFTEHFLPEHMSRVSLSFLVDTMDKRRGGCAPNIAYTLALLGERPLLLATAGEDFGEYRQWLDSAGIDTAHVKQIPGKFCASFFCSTDTANNQIASFYTGAMADAGQLSFRAVKDCGLAIIAPNDPDAMVQYAEECRVLKIPFIFDPGQQCARMEGDQLRDGVTGATIVIVNDYELELLRQKNGMSESDILVVARTLIVTTGEHGSVHQTTRELSVPAVRRRSRIRPVWDAFRGGLLKGLAIGADPEVCCRLGSVAAGLALEHPEVKATPTVAGIPVRCGKHFNPLR
jgi:5'-methylthioadenosine phosphorylase